MTTTTTSRTLAWLRQFAKLWGFALFCVLVVYIFREVVLPFLFAILVAYILAPLVARAGNVRIGARPFPRWAAVIILYVFILSGMGWFIGYFVPKLSGDFARLFREAPALFAKVNKDWLPRAGAWIDTHFAPEEVDPDDGLTSHAEEPQAPRAILVEPLKDGRFRIDLEAVTLEVKQIDNGRYLIAPPVQDVVDGGGAGKWERSIKQWLATRLKSTEGESRRVLEYGQKFIGGVVFGIGRLFLVLMVAAFILIDLEHPGFLRSLVPERIRDDYDLIYAGIDRGLSGVIRGQLLICLINGILTYIGLWLFEVKYPLILAGIAAIDEPDPDLRIDPVVGPDRHRRAGLVGDTSISRMGVMVLAWIIGIHLIEANLLNPKIIGNAAKIHPVLVIFALFLGEHSYGLVGALLAVPVASIIQTIFVYYRKRPRGHMPGATPPPAMAPTAP